jgi:hypothetical protein
MRSFTNRISSRIDHKGDIYGGKVTIYGGGRYASWILLPIVPPKEKDAETEKVAWLIKAMKERRWPLF